MKRSLVALVVIALGSGACGYFNSMYNAQRRYAAAESASSRGEVAVARQAWLDAIDGAASSYRNHPDSRWADDALLLIARARFRLGEFEAAHAAARAVVDLTDDPRAAAEARTVMGAAEYRLGHGERAAAVLDTAIAGAPDMALREAHLWRARARFASGHPGGWEDLDAAMDGDREIAIDAALTGVDHAIASGDRDRFDVHLRHLLGAREGARFADSLRVLIESAGTRFGYTTDLVPDVARGPWPSADRDPFELVRAGVVARAGDTTAAVAAALNVASRAAAANAASARVLAAELELPRAASVDDLERIRGILLPALTNDRARPMLRTIRVVEVLLDRAARNGQPLALFAAAEMVRDELKARTLARELFLSYADLVPDAVWAPKALLAAAALASGTPDGPPIADRFSSQPDNVYVRAVTEGDRPEAFTVAEERLARSLKAIRSNAFIEADQRDIRVGSAIARLDSLRERVLADSMSLMCGTMLDSLAIVGIRADSVRSACMRGDTVGLASFLTVDTLLLRDTTRDTMNVRVPRRAVQDTFSSRFLR